MNTIWIDAFMWLIVVVVLGMVVYEMFFSKMAKATRRLRKSTAYLKRFNELIKAGRNEEAYEVLKERDRVC